jgi:hypothetical protein
MAHSTTKELFRDRLAHNNVEKAERLEYVG